VIRFEEGILREKFGPSFANYASVVPALYPSLSLYPESSTTFSWQQVLRNKEYNAVLGIVLIYVILFFKQKLF
jgi:hypothetical protein